MTDNSTKDLMNVEKIIKNKSCTQLATMKK